MPRETFDRELKRLQDDMLTMGSMVEKALVESVKILKNKDFEGAKRLIADDRIINEKRYALESDCLTLIATQQPVATDMRTVAAVLELAGELERVGDYAKGIANINLMIGEEPFIKPLIDIPRMADKAADMLHRALGAFIARDVELARTLPAEDDEVDALYNQVQRELLTYIMSRPTTFDQAMRLLWVAHNLERAADRVTNICERVIFTATGKIGDISAPKE